MLTLATPPKALLLTPGASANRNHETLVQIANALPEVHVERLTLNTTSVPSAVKKIHQAANALATNLNIDPLEIAYGGRSFGGRACSVAVANGLAASALVLLSYPLHPPGKPQQLRVEHFNDISVPSLFISGERDPFGTREEFQAHCPSISGQWQLETVKGNHSAKGQEQRIVVIIRQFFALD